MNPKNIIVAQKEADEGKISHDIPRILVEMTYQALLNRSPDPGGLAHYSRLARTTGGFAEMLRSIISSEEFKIASCHCQMADGGSAGYGNDTTVFLHIERIGGTSIQNMVTGLFSPGDVYREHSDTLYFCNRNELAKYKVFWVTLTMIRLRCYIGVSLHFSLLFEIQEID